jgi:hypothetical protein
MPKDPKGNDNVRRSLTPEMHLTALVLLAATVIFGSSRFTGATTVNANSVSQSDIVAAIGSAVDGDIVTIPAGTATWTDTLQVNKAITLQGAGVGVTIIKDAMQSGQLIRWSLPAGRPSRLTGIEFQDGGRTKEAAAPGGLLRVDGSNTNGATFRWDNSKWNNLNGVPVFDTVIGVIDHNTFVQDRNQTAIYIYGSSWDGRSFGDGSWAAPTDLGSGKFLFIEDNVFTHSANTIRIVTDAHAGARFVVRHNSIFNANVVNHGTESTGRVRGGRAMEVYKNKFTGTNVNRLVGGSRSGVTLFHDNTIGGFQVKPRFNLSNFRNFFPFKPWSGADGLNAWDVNQPGVFFTGTAASNSVGTTVTVSGANWAQNQWVGYTIRRLSDKCNSASLNYSYIQSSTSNTLSYTDNGGFHWISTMSFCAGDRLEIRKVDHALDQPGRARGSLITGDPPIRATGWNDQVTEPCYSWNNGQVNFSGGPGVRLNEHYFNDTPMPGYTEFTYPHPLTGSLPWSPPTTTTTTTTRTSLRKPWGKKEKKTKQGNGKPWKKTKGASGNDMAKGQENLGD